MLNYYYWGHDANLEDRLSFMAMYALANEKIVLPEHSGLDLGPV
jgi:hypothetical protein